MDSLFQHATQVITDLQSNPQWAYGLILLSFLTFALSLILIPWLVIRLPKDYFSANRRGESALRQYHPVVYWLIRLLKNLFSAALIVAGILMLVLPGQGILSILIGISIGDFPGKYRLERYLVTRPGVLKSINWIRKKARKPLLEL